jgi:hypothetical protein
MAIRSKKKKRFGSNCIATIKQCCVTHFSALLYYPHQNTYRTIF